MEYQNTRNLLDNTPNQPSKFRTRNWTEINDESRGKYKKDNQIDLKFQCQGQVYMIVVIIYLRGNYNNYWNRSRR